MFIESRVSVHVYQLYSKCHVYYKNVLRRNLVDIPVSLS